MEKLKKAVIREELLALTQDWGKAIILDKVIWWTGIVYDMERSDRERIEEMKKIDSEKAAEFESKLRDGWFYKTVEEFESEIFGVQSSKTINRKLNELILQKYVLADKTGSRNQTKYDRKTWYRANIELIQKDLLQLGYPLEGYKLPEHLLQSISQNEKCEETTSEAQQEEVEESPESPISQNKKWKSQNKKSISQSEESKSQIEISNSQNEMTITDTTTYTTPNSISDKTLSLPILLSSYLESDVFKKREREITGLTFSDIIKRYETLKDIMTVEKFISVLEYLTLNNDNVRNFTTLFRLCQEKLDQESKTRRFDKTESELLPLWFQQLLQEYKKATLSPIHNEDQDAREARRKKFLSMLEG